MSKSSPKPPPVPSAQTIASAQTGSNVDTALAQAALNNVNQVSPYGSSTFNQTGQTTVDGQTVPQYTETTSLSPLGNAILGGQGSLETGALNTANQILPQVGYTPLNFNTADSSTLNSSPQQLDTNAAKAVYNEQASFLDPQWTQNQKDLEDQLSRQGIPVGSDAYNSAMTNFNNQKTQAYQAAQNSATAQGAQSAMSLFDMALTGQQQNVAQQQQAQAQPINLIQALLGATPTTPTQTPAAQIPSQVSPTNVVGAYQTADQAAQANYQAQLAQQNAFWGGLASLGGQLGAAAILA